jgi:lysozyme
MKTGYGSALDRKSGANVAKIRPYLQALVEDVNVKAFLRVIREEESSQDDDVAYRIIVGYPYIDLADEKLNDHPRKRVKLGNGVTSSAAGAYQFQPATWDSLAAQLGLSGFYPGNQDRAAIGLIAELGAVNDVVAGRLKSAIAKVSIDNGWTSLPGGSQERQSYAHARAVFLKYGGQVAVGN